MSDYKNQVASTIRAFRRRSGITQEELARMFNETEPITTTTSRYDVAKYEATTNSCPGAKWFKFEKVMRDFNNLLRVQQ